MKKFWLFLIAFGIVFLVGCQNTSVQDTTVSDVTSSKNQNIQAKASISQDILSLVSQHADKKSCWTVISGYVYDLTSFLGKHPGWDKAILASCGKDATEMFDDKHGMDPKKWEWLKTFKIMIQ